jgi:hypothetical protein
VGITVPIAETRLPIALSIADCRFELGLMIGVAQSSLCNLQFQSSIVDLNRQSKSAIGNHNRQASIKSAIGNPNRQSAIGRQSTIGNCQCNRQSALAIRQ